ncbi:MAG: CPBP family intramembrane metalloprotease [Clostridia bacterium]|nr:CPBP family intramembrane metalloprotease [Clostridia bacterium]
MTNGQNKGIFGGLLGEPTKEKGAGLAFSIAAILSPVVTFVFMAALSLCGVSYTAQDDWYLYCAYLIPQACFLAAAIFFFKWMKTPFKAECGRQVRAHWLFYPLAVTLQIGLLSLSALNGWFLDLLGGFGFEDAGILLPSMDGFGFVGVLITVALLPAVFEELLFRGVVLKGLAAFGKTGAILLCGALFSLYHQNPAQTVYQFICGAAFAWVALNAKSILPTVVAHFCNNAFILFAEKFGFYAKIETGLLIASIVCLAASVAGLVAYEIFSARKKKDLNNSAFDKKTSGTGCDETVLSKPEKKKARGLFWLCAAVGVGICLLSWILAFVTGLK